MKQLYCRQKQKYIQTMTKGIKKQIEVAINNLAEEGVLNTDNFPRIIRLGDKIVPTVIDTINKHLTNIAESVVNRVKLVDGAEALDLDKINGDKVTLEKTNYFFKEMARDVFGNCVQRKILPTKRAKVSVYNLIMDGSYTEIFGGMSGNIDRLCLTQPQVVQFIEKHGDYLLKGGYGTFFLVKCDNKFFVMQVCFDKFGYMLIEKDILSDNNFAQWSAKSCRIVVLKHVLAN